ncbi:hypothetical protein Q7C_750 [Methylophaga frappieri]|uniref:Uncharacterized protein n=1 Tax=Methylophaga frappieri (strain ATCC BAA-2434 / DSM 25690 / JAM7) TaxID=754477 RepID=I1YG78_METFJ|nr:hypothetical protein Q7C_750 [Methylophaga frappieri]
MSLPESLLMIALLSLKLFLFRFSHAVPLFVIILNNVHICRIRQE